MSTTALRSDSRYPSFPDCTSSVTFWSMAFPTPDSSLSVPFCPQGASYFASIHIAEL